MRPNSSNMHMIPASDEIRKELLDIREGELVRITGQLVDVLREDGRWESSTRRDDTGDGACEIVLVRHIDRDPAI